MQTVALNLDVYSDAQAADKLIASTFTQAGAEYLVMAGYMRMVGPAVLSAYEDRVINLHPALLPSFKGAHAIQDAFDFGVKVTGVTVHFANAEYDKGPIIAQHPAILHEDETVDTLEARIHEVDHDLYPWVLRHLAAGDITIDPTTRTVHVANA
mgnify:CR=1 FL=1